MASSDELAAQLIQHLGSIAGYNDKGRLWSNHTPDEVRANRQQAQAVILRLVAAIGTEAFSPQLLEKLQSGAAVLDESGDIEAQARAELAAADRSSAR
ncbi:MAG TPA: hypothetical protein VGM83_01685 [Devosiaceae bacterium]|jgi:hypothetical protein